MTTIVETITNISENIQESFSELIKLVLRKTITPVLNPLGRNSRTLYNASTGRFERGYVGYDPSDSVNKYTYQMTTETLGWTGNDIVTFKITPKTNPYLIPGRGQTVGPRYRPPTSPLPLVLTRQPLEPLPSVGPSSSSNMNFSNLMNYIAGRTAASVIPNRVTGLAYLCSMNYTDGFEQLNSVGQDIVNQTDALIAPQDSARMSTALLRVGLFNLERILFFFMENYPDLYSSYLDMVRLLNSENNCNTPTIISLIGTLSVVNWEGVPEIQKQGYLNRLGENFITDFNSNELIAILLKSSFPELILTSSYLYSLQKMLYIVFGYNQLVPNLFSQRDPVVNPELYVPNQYIQRYNFRNLGAFITRGTLPVEDQPAIPPRNTPYEPDCLPPPETAYDFIKVFCELYPIIVETMGGCNFPTPCQNLFCEDIPNNYFDIDTIPDFLLRFTEHSYCVYLEYQDSRMVFNSVGVQIDNRIRYLKTF
jgi:hypothetical protein